MFYHTAYDFRIRSTLPLPELIAAEAPADVFVLQGKDNPLPSAETAVQGSCFRGTAKEMSLFWDKVGTFRIREGREIIIDSDPAVEERLLRHFLLGPALAVLLHQRGLLVLHASAVAVNGGAALFLGGSGWGKSTTAAALLVRGHELMSDDVTGIRLDAGGPTVLPGVPQLKLSPEAAAAVLGDAAVTLPRLHPEAEKLAHHVGPAFARAPLPLTRIYVLAECTGQSIQPIKPGEALVELVRHSYCARMLPAGGAATHFRQCASLADGVPVRRLSMQRSLPALPDLAKLVEDDLATIG